MTRRIPDNGRQSPVQLRALLDIVGPTEATALLAQLHVDLMSCDQLIADATPTHDWQAIRRASHNLTALAGTAGATLLQRMAEEVNRIAHAEDRERLADIAPMTREALAALADQIRSLALTRGPR